MRSLITGGAGFIGSHLVENLLAQGDEVIVLDDMSTGAMTNLTGVIDDPRLTIVQGSVLDSRAVQEAVNGSDRVFHLAAAVGVRRILDHPLRGLRINLHGTENVLEAASQRSTPVLLVSTSEIYGKNTADALREDSDRVLGSPLLSRWNYAAAKGLDESFAAAYHHELGLPVQIVRLFNTVGPRQTGRYGMVVPNLVGQALEGRPLTVYGDGQQTRCFSFVRDVVPAIVRIAELPARPVDAFNLGGAREISILELAELIVKVTGSSSEIQLVPYEQAYPAGFEDMRRRVPDNTHATEVVGYEAVTPLEEIIGVIADDLRARSGAPEEAARA